MPLRPRLLLSKQGGSGGMTSSYKISGRAFDGEVDVLCDFDGDGVLLLVMGWDD